MPSRELPLGDWLEERRANAMRIAKTKRGADREGWLEDAHYFARAKEAVAALVNACTGDHANAPLRKYIALKILRAWNGGTAGFDAHVVAEINAWIDGGMEGPIHWPEGPFFSAWAEENGFSNVGGYVGFKFRADLQRKGVSQ